MISRPYQMSMVWWEGVIESRHDPLLIGRVQVRVLGIHSDNLQQLPESDLHWMQVMMPVTSASNSGVGESPYLVEGSHVIGFFRDGDSAQDGVVMGSVNGIPQQARRSDIGFNDHRSDLSSTSVPGRPSKTEYVDGVGVKITDVDRTAYPNRLDEPDLSRLATRLNLDKDTTISSKKASQATQKNIPTASGGSFSEPDVKLTSKYPYNHVTESESGNVIEIDDTPSNERVHIFHRSGSFKEMLHDGDVVNKSAKDEYNIIHGSQYEHIEATRHVTIDKGMTLYINKDNESTGLSVKIGDGGNLDVTVSSGNLNLTVNGNVTQTINGDMLQNVDGDYVINVDGRFKVSASRIDLN